MRSALLERGGLPLRVLMHGGRTTAVAIPAATGTRYQETLAVSLGCATLLMSTSEGEGHILAGETDGV